MSTIFLATGNANIESQWFEINPEGECVALGELDLETMKPDGPVQIFGDWDAAGYLAHVLELLQPSRQTNIPDFKAIVRAATKYGDEDLICKYCRSYNCLNCVISEWKEETPEGDERNDE